MMLTQTDIVADEVEVVTRGDGHCGPAPLGEPGVGLVQRLMYIDKGIDARLSVRGRTRKIGVGQGDHVRGKVLQSEERGREGGK